MRGSASSGSSKSGLPPPAQILLVTLKASRDKSASLWSTLTLVSAQLIFSPIRRGAWARSRRQSLDWPAAPARPQGQPSFPPLWRRHTPTQGPRRGGLAVAQGPEPPGRPAQGSDSPQSLRHRSLLLPRPLSVTPGDSGGRSGPACLGHQLRAPRAAPTTPGWVPR